MNSFFGRGFYLDLYTSPLTTESMLGLGLRARTRPRVRARARARARTSLALRLGLVRARRISCILKG